MKLVDALKVLQGAPASAPPFGVGLACGCTPLHLQTFLAAHLQQRLPGRRVVVHSGLYGDCLGNLERLADDPEAREAAVLVLEWSDLDPRLGLRRLSGWHPRDLADIAATVAAHADRFARAIRRAAERAPLAIGLPTLPVPPVAFTPGGQASPFELAIRSRVADLAAQVAEGPGVRLVQPQRLDHLSPPGQRLDVAAELAAGFPYLLPHAESLARLLAQLVAPPAPKKGLITDLDDTLWKGLVGEVGRDGIAWDLDRKAHRHGLYQQMLRSLAGSGVLLAVASKNDPALVAEAFQHDELAALKESLFPLEVSWGPKSEAVGRILKAWNIAADSVVFLDDSPMELAEVQAAHPDLECILFPKESDAEVYRLLDRLRDLFGKAALSADDAIRLDSLRRASAFAAEAGEGAAAGAPPEEFLARAEAELVLNAAADPPDPRALELVNKTNQFNLNGRRFTEGEWRSYLARPDTFLFTVAYKDKFGPLGTIAVLAGRRDDDGRTLHLDVWVMSCRAFSRRIEHACLKYLFETFGPEEVAFDFQPTPKNGPIRAFLAGFGEAEPDAPVRIARPAFDAHCPPLYHQTRDPLHG